MHEESLERLIQMARETNRQIEYTTERVVVRASPHTGDGGDSYETVSVSRPMTLTGGPASQTATEPQQEPGEEPKQQAG